MYLQATDHGQVCVVGGTTGSNATSTIEHTFLTQTSVNVSITNFNDNAPRIVIPPMATYAEDAGRQTLINRIFPRAAAV